MYIGLKTLIQKKDFDVEYLLIDNASTDNTYNIAHIKRNTFNSDVSTVSAMFIPDNNWRALHCT